MIAEFENRPSAQASRTPSGSPRIAEVVTIRHAGAGEQFARPRVFGQAAIEHALKMDDRARMPSHAPPPSSEAACSPSRARRSRPARRRACRGRWCRRRFRRRARARRACGREKAHQPLRVVHARTPACTRRRWPATRARRRVRARTVRRSRGRVRCREPRRGSRACRFRRRRRRAGSRRTGCQ